jgi:RNA polymerase sigma-70 factor, ECF subfamily
LCYASFLGKIRNFKIDMLATSQTLLKRLKEPGSSEWPRFVNLYTPLLYHWAKKLGLNPNDAADIVQSVLTITVRKLPTFDYQPESSFRGWLRTVLHNEWKRSLREKTKAGTAMAEPPESMVFDSNIEEEQEYARILTSRAMEIIRPEFSDTNWQAFELLMIEQKPVVEVATRLSVKIGTVYAAKSKILARLRNELDGFLELD